MLADTRGLSESMEFEFVNSAQAAMALVGRVEPLDAEAARWARARRVCLEIDGRLVPLATAPAAVLRQFESTSGMARVCEGVPLASDAPSSAARDHR
jgi:hypothetical protein